MAALKAELGPRGYSTGGYSTGGYNTTSALIGVGGGDGGDEGVAGEGSKRESEDGSDEEEGWEGYNVDAVINNFPQSLRGESAGLGRRAREVERLVSGGARGSRGGGWGGHRVVEKVRLASI